MDYAIKENVIQTKTFIFISSSWSVNTLIGLVSVYLMDFGWNFDIALSR